MYPILEIDKKKIKDNIHLINNLCINQGIQYSAVIKGCGGLEPVNDLFIDAGCHSLASSRLSQLKRVKDKQVTTMLLRLPMIDEIETMLAYVDISLNSEKMVIERINEVCRLHSKRHAVIVMYDLGDLREGCWHEEELVDLAAYVESLSHVDLLGVGTNLTCYGSVKATEENMNHLVSVAVKVEARIGRKLELISGGSTSTLPLVIHNKLPKRINHLRLGESILLGRDLRDFFDCKLDLHNDTFILKAQLVEVKTKPSYPIGQRVVDAFGNQPVYIDKGFQTRGILAVGRQDFGDHNKLICTDENIELVGSSSDHLIINIKDGKYRVGDVLSFQLYYQSMLYLSLSQDINKSYVI